MITGPGNQPSQPPPGDSNTDVPGEVEMRLRIYLELGFDLEDAENLSRRDDVDWHLVKRMVEAGCDHDTALRIVA